MASWRPLRLLLGALGTAPPRTWEFQAAKPRWIYWSLASHLYRLQRSILRGKTVLRPLLHWSLEALKLWSLNRCTWIPPDKHYHSNTFDYVTLRMRIFVSPLRARERQDQLLHLQTMASFQRQTGSSETGGWLVILNKSLADSELHRLLSTHNYRLRGESLACQTCQTIWNSSCMHARWCMCMPVQLQNMHTYTHTVVCMCVC